MSRDLRVCIARISPLVPELRLLIRRVVPFASRPYRGEFRVRIPPHLHRRLAIEAAEANVSLNRLVSAKLAQG